jgi:hypothetical protein
MIKVLLLCCLTLSLSTGCAFFRKSERARNRVPVTAEVQETFRKRWVDKRVADLVALGGEAEAARIQAEAEFRATYDFSGQAETK